MPKPESENFDRAFERKERTGNLHPYVSKSRLVEYNKNPRHFHIKYVIGIREPENRYMRRGSEIHLAIEHYYENVVAGYEAEGSIRDDLISYLPDVSEWSRWTEPYITNFLVFEYSRLAECRAHEDEAAFPPVDIEAEVWDWRGDDDVPLMGFADVILNAASVPQVESREGVVIIDHKTGKVPLEKYRDEGIYLELEYYAKLFGDSYEVAAIAGYYPLKNEILVGELSDDRRGLVNQLISEIETLGTDVDDYPTKPGPLCCWGKEPEKQSSFYNICDCNWATPQGPGPTYRTRDKKPMGD